MKTEFIHEPATGSTLYFCSRHAEYDENCASCFLERGNGSETPAKREWVDVNDRLPAHGQRVLIARYDHLKNPGVTVARYHEGRRFWLEDAEYVGPVTETVLYWQEFPEPPKG